MSGTTDPRVAGTRRALLIGSETYGLSGCNADVALMRDVLTTRGFTTVDVRTDGDATRAGIIDGLDALIGAIAQGDAAVVYYSGHGGRVVRPDFEERKAAGLTVNFQFIVPFDLAKSDTGDFRGITAEELTQFQRRLTDAFHALGEVPNVTTILDCCHAGYMARDANARQKSIDLESDVFKGAKSFRMRGIREHLQKLGAQAQLGGLVTNPDVVRLVACQPEQSAYEFPSTRGGRHGALTDALATVLEGLGRTPVSWAIAADLVRRRVRALQPEQRPDVEGPAERVLFSSESAPTSSALAVTAIGGVTTIEAAGLLGIAVDDEFDIVDARNGASIGQAVVKKIVDGAAVLRVSADAAGAVVDGTAIAIPTRISVPKLLIHVGDLGRGAGPLRKEIAKDSRLTVGADAAGGVAGVVPGSTDGLLALTDSSGARWRTTEFADDATGRRAIVEALRAIAVGHRLLDLASGRGDSALEPVVNIEFGRIDSAAGAPPVRTPLTLHGARLRSGERVYLTVRNTGPEPLFAWIFDVGVSGRSGILSKDARSGYALGPTGAEDDGFELWGQDGEKLYWPEDVPTDVTPAERPESFVILVADRRADLSSLSPPAGASRGSPRSELEAVLDEARTGTREAPPAGGRADPLRYRLDTVEFFLSPA